MTFQAFAFVRLESGGVVRHVLGSYATADEAEHAAERAVSAFADYAQCEGRDGTSRLIVRREYAGVPIPPGTVHRVGMFRDDAANDGSQATPK